MDKIKFDGFVRKNIKEDGLEQPSLNFTNAIRSKIEEEKKAKQILVYTPLIKSGVWYAMGAILIGGIGVVFYGGNVVKSNWWPEKILEQWSKVDLSNSIPEFPVSDIYVYAFVGLAFFVCLQIVVLKAHFAKHYL
ncbi:hypothetical protein HPE56_14565 [Maribacter sp. ANRC-HE7]|uniref:DUF4321 domain-containing protein n=1 Tax=Maribacter aquimaris TaxID=2737171 RepID=A0ABR7V315_9FLAO|nr:hypothetical protein [Maribacter aquimaris]MBD0779021.1 hypothetical protein [Maribacter aquimaris]